MIKKRFFSRNVEFVAFSIRQPKFMNMTFLVTKKNKIKHCRKYSSSFNLKVSPELTPELSLELNLDFFRFQSMSSYFCKECKNSFKDDTFYTETKSIW